MIIYCHACKREHDVDVDYTECVALKHLPELFSVYEKINEIACGIANISNFTTIRIESIHDTPPQSTSALPKT